jgi:hypothetical protein
MALLAIATGIVVLLISIKKLRTLSLVPKMTVHEVKRLSAEVTGKEPSSSLARQVPKAERASAEIQDELEAMHHSIGHTVDELKDHLTLRSLANEAKHQIKIHPVPTALLGAGVSLVGFLMVRKARRRAHHRAPNTSTAQKHAYKRDGLLGKLLTIIKAIELLDRARSTFSTHHQTLRDARRKA